MVDIAGESPERTKMSDRTFVVFTLLGAFALSALTFLSFGVTGIAIYQTTWWLIIPLFGPFKPDEAFVQVFFFGVVWPWVMAGILIAMRFRYAAERHSPMVRRLHYAAAIYGTTLVLACLYRAMSL